MNTCVLQTGFLAVALLSAALFPALSAPFTYQGVLIDSAQPAQSTYDLRFHLYSSNEGEVPISPPVYLEDLAISHGYFSVTLEFGEGIFNGEPRWLEIGIRPSASVAGYTVLRPRQQITAAPYAMTAANLAGPCLGPLNSSSSSNFFGGAFVGDGSALTNVDACTFGGLDLTNFARLAVSNYFAAAQSFSAITVFGEASFPGGVKAPFRVQGDTTDLAEIRLAAGQVVFSATDTSGDHRGTGLLIRAGDGMGPDQNGGNIALVPGFGTGQGLGGRVIVDGFMKVTGPIAATTLFGDGQGIVNVAASNLTGVLHSDHITGLYTNGVRFSNPSNQFRGSFSGDGNGVSNLNASALAGVVPDSALVGSYGNVLALTNPSNLIQGNFSGDGSGLANVQAANLIGMLRDQQIGGSYGSSVQFTSPANQFYGAFTGDGHGLSNLTASAFAGVVPSAALAGTYDGVLSLTNPSNTYRGIFVGDGLGLTNVTASQLAGALGSAQLSGAYNNAVQFTNPANSFRGTFAGDGTGLTLSASSLIGVVPATALSGTYGLALNLSNSANTIRGVFAGNGVGLSNVNAARVGGFAATDLAQVQASNHFTAGQTFSAPVLFRGAVSVHGGLQVTGAVTAATLAGNGFGVTNLPTSNLVGVLGNPQLQGTYANPVQFTSSANQFNGAFTGNASGLMNLSAATLLGVVPNTALAGAYGNALNLTHPANAFQGAFAGDGSRLLNLATSNLVGALPSARLEGLYSSSLRFTNPTNQFHGTFVGDGGGLTNLAASTLSGALPSNLLVGTYNNALTLANPANTVRGSFNGDGSALSGLNASALSTGTVPDARLSANVALLNGSPVFSGSVSAQGDLLAPRLSIGSGHGLSGPFASIAGGQSNLAAGAFSLAAGRRAKARHDGSFVWTDSSDSDFGSSAPNQFVIRASGGVGINTTNPAGRSISVNGPAGISGTNTLEFGADAIGKHQHAGKIGYQTFTPGALDIVGAGTNAAGRKIKFWAESGATFQGTGANPLMTLTNTLDEPASIALATPFSSWQFGQNKPPDAPNAFDSFFIYQQTAGRTRLLITDAGRVGIGTNNPTHPLHLGNGAYCTAAGVWTSVSDREVKEDFRAIHPREVLAKVINLPITQWKYKAETNGVRHLGPVAQDFHAAFGLGESDRTIGSVDADGVALAAVQGLNEVIREKEAQIDALKAKNHEIEQRVKRLEALFGRLQIGQDDER